MIRHLLNTIIAFFTSRSGQTADTSNHENSTVAVTDTPTVISPLVAAISPETALNAYLTDLRANAKTSPATIRNYASDLRQYLHFAQIAELTQLRDETLLHRFTADQHGKGLKEASIHRKIVSLNLFVKWLEKHRYIVPAPTPPPLWQNPQVLAESEKFFWFKKAEKPASVIPQVTTRNFSLPPQLSMAVIGALSVLVIWFGYRQFIADAPQKLAFPATPQALDRILSFQGRLTDAVGTPITEPTDVTFRIWSEESGGDLGTCTGLAGEECLYSTGVCSPQIDPDQDGIFSTVLGESCGGTIPDAVFSEHAQLWLEIQVQSEVLEPRQRIATVPFAANADTLRGFPIDATASAVRSSVVVMNQWGEILIGEQSPRLRSISGTFQISGQTLSLTTENNGNIQLQPHGTGQVNLVGGTTNTNFLNVSSSTLSTGNLITGVVSNNNTGYKFLSFSGGSSPDEKFWVDALGNVSADGYLQVSGATISATYAGSTPLTVKGTGGTVFTIANNGNITAAGDLQLNGGDLTTAAGNLTIAPAGGNVLFTGNLSVGGYATVSGSLALGTANAEAGPGNLSLSGNLHLTGRFYDTSASAGSAGNVLTSTGTGTAWSSLGSLSVGNADTLDGLDSLQFLRSDTSDNYTSGTLAFDSGTTLDINGNLSIADTDIALDGASTNLTATGDFSVNTNHLFIEKATGEVGIGTNNPATNLHINSTTSPVLRLSGGASSNQYLEFVQNGNTKGVMGYASGSDTMQIAYGANFGTNALAINSSGNVGIGTTGPDARLDVLTTADEKLRLTETDGSVYTSFLVSDGGDLTINTTGGNVILADNNVLNVGGGTASAFNFFANSVVNNTTATSDEDLYIGGKLEVDGAIRFDGSLTSANISNTGSLSSVGSTVSLNNDSNFAVNIGTGTSTGAVSIGGGSGTLAINTTSWDVTSAGAISGLTGYAQASGNFAISGSGTFSTGTGAISLNGNTTITGSNTLTVASLTANRFVKTTTGGLLTTSQYIDLTTEVTGVLPLANGGTNKNMTASAGAIAYSDADSLELSAVGNVGECLVSNGTSAPTWSSCFAAGGASKWVLQSTGVLNPVNNTADLILGDNTGTPSTASAKFAVLNLDSGTPTASVSATGLAGRPGIAIAGDGSIQSLRNGTLTIGGNTTGNIALMPLNGTGYVGIGTAAPGSKLEVNDAAGNNFLKLQETATADNYAYLRSTDLVIHRSSGSNAGLELITTKTSTWGATGGYIALKPDNVEAMRILVGGNVGIGTTTPTATLDVAGSASTSGTLAFRGTTDPKIDILNGENFGIRTSVGGDTGLSEKLTVLNGGNVGIGVTAPASLLEVGSNSGGVVSISTNNQSGSLATPLEPKLQFLGYADNVKGAILVQDKQANQLGGWMKFQVADSSNALQDRMIIDRDGNVGIGDTNPTALLTVGNGDLFQVNSSGAIAAATGITSSGNITFSGLTANRFVKTTTGGQLTTSQFIDLTTEVTGILPLANGGTNKNMTASAGSVVYSDADSFELTAVGNSGDCLLSQGSGAPQWGSCIAAGGGSKWVISDARGVISPINNTTDLILGDNSATPATASAKFAVLGLNTTTPVASVSATGLAARPGVAISGDGSIQAVRNNTLTIGGNTTGNIALMPLNGAGRVGIGTATPTVELDILNTSSPELRLSKSATDYLKFEKKSSSGSQIADVALTGEALIDLDPVTTDGTSKSSVRLFRNVTTTDAATGFTIYLADGTSTVQSFFGAKGNSYFNASAGNMGIGTTGPDAKLDVLTTNDEKLRLTEVDNSVYASFLVSDGGDLTINTTGGQLNLANNITFNIGGLTGQTTNTISNSTTPTYASDDNDLYVEGTMEIGASLYVANSPIYVEGVPVSADSLFQNTANLLHPYGPNASVIDFAIGGTSTASAKFIVKNIAADGIPVASVSATTAANRPGIAIAGDGSIQSLRNGTMTIGGNTTGNIALMPLNGSGRVGVGTASPSERFHVSGARSLLNNILIGEIASTYDIIQGQSAGGLRLTSAGHLTLESGAGEVVRVTSGGNVGIGTTGPDARLDVLTTADEKLRLTEVDGSVYASFLVSDAGDLTISATGTQLIVSDQIQANAGINRTSADLALTTTTSGNITLTTAATSGLVNVLTGNLKVGTGTPTLTLDGNDGYITGTFEVDGAVRLDGAVTLTSSLTQSGGAVSFNNDSNNAVNIATGTSTGAVTIGGTGTQTISIANGAGAKTLNLGSSNTTSTTTILSGSGGVNINANNNQPTNIGTGTSTGLVSIGGGSGTVGISSTTWGVVAATGNITTAGDLAINGGDLTSTATTFNFDIGNTGTLNFRDGTNTLMALKDQGTYAFLNLAGKSTTGDPATCAEGDIYYNSADDSIKVCHTGNTWEALDGGGGSSVWSDLTAPTANLSLNLGTYTTQFDFTGTSTTGWTYNADSVNTGIGMLMSFDALSTGTGLSLTSTSTALASGGKLLNIDWSPAGTNNSTGDLVKINTGTGDTIGNLLNITSDNSAVFQVKQAKITSAVPHEFTAAGDVVIAYDIQLSNQTSSFIKSNAPLTIEAGESFENNNLTLKTYGTGATVVDGKFSVGTQQTLTANSTTPSVAAGNLFITANTGATLISNFTSGTAGQVIYVEINDANTDFDCTANANLNCGTVDITIPAAGDLFTWIYDGSTWNLIGWMDASHNGYNTAGGADLAEMYVSNETLTTGEIVSIDPLQPIAVTKSQPNDASRVIGVVSTEPYIIMGESETAGYQAYPIALAGRVPVKMSNSSSPVLAGDMITISSESGKGQKATTAGFVIGRALESWTPNSGKQTVSIFVNPIWYDPQVYLTNNGLMNSTNVTTETLTATNANVSLLQAVQATIQNLSGQIANLQQVITQRLTAARVETDLITPLSGKDLTLKIGQDGNANTGRLQVKNKQDQTVFTLDETGTATLAGNLNVQANASISGEVRAGSVRSQTLAAAQAELNQLRVNEATLSGDLFLADGRSLQDLLSDNEAYLASLSAETSDLRASVQATPSAITAESFNEFLTQLTGSADASVSAALQALNQQQNLNLTAESLVLAPDAIFIHEYLGVNGYAQMNAANVQTTLTVANSMLFTADTISTAADTLFIQPTGAGKIDLLASTMIIDTNGTVMINGNLFVSGDVNISGDLNTNVIKPNDFSRELVLKLATQSGQVAGAVDQSVFAIKDASDSAVASIDASGSARFSQLTAQGVVIQQPTSEASDEAEQAIEIDRNRTVGSRILPANQTNLVIENNNITADTLIYLTPTSDTGNQVLYVKAKNDCAVTVQGDVCQKTFTVGVNNPVNQNITFNYWIVKQE